MTHAEKLQQIFEAALKDSSDINKPLKRAFPTSLGAPTVAAPGPPSEPVVKLEPVIEVRVPVAPAQAFVAPATNAGLSDPESAELGRLLEKQQQRKVRKRRRDTLVTLAVAVALTGGGSGWFVQSPQRVQAMKEAIREVRSLGDVKSMVAKYKVALDKIGDRSHQIDQATENLGVSSNQDDVKDPNMDAEMLAMMGGKGKTIGQRNQMVQEAFATTKDNPTEKDAGPTAALTTDGSYR